MASPVVVVGAGLAGTSLARELRKLDRDVPVVVVSADRADIYAKPNLSNALAAGKEPAALVQSSGADWAARTGVDLRAATRVVRIDRDRRTLVTDRGEIAYGSLVLATGAAPVRLSLAGDGADRVRSVNSLDDYALFRQELSGAETVAVVGGGLVGCEFADDLRASGRRVVVFDPGTHPLGRLLPPRTGSWMRRALEAAGIRFLAGTGVVEVHREGPGLRLVDTRGESHRVDAVLSAVGLRPHLDIAQAAGLAVNRGIAVDRFLRTSDPDIHALGDGAEVEGMVLPFVQPVLHAARALAATLAGKPTEVRYPAMPVVVKTPSAPLVVCPPPPGSAGEWSEEETEAGMVAVFQDGSGIPLGFALAGDAARQRNAWAAKMPDLLGSGMARAA